MTILKSLFNFLCLTILVLVPLNVHAEVLISEKNQTNQDAIVFSMKKGEEISKQITIKNISNEDINIALDVEDLVQLDGGAVATKKTSQDSGGLSQYAKLEVKNLSIPSQESIDIPIKITIPNEIISGEYGLAFTLAQSSNNDEKSSIKNVISRGLKMYIFLEEGVKTLEAEIENVKILENKSIQFQAKNTGSVFSKIVGEYILNSKNGDQKRGGFQRDIISKESKNFLVSLPKDFSGEGELKIEYSLESLTPNGEGASKSEPKNVSLRFDKNEDENGIGKQNIFQSIWIQIAGGILILGLLGFVLRREILLLISLKKK
jgi:hypothetical protein